MKEHLKAILAVAVLTSAAAFFYFNLYAVKETKVDQSIARDYSFLFKSKIIDIREHEIDLEQIKSNHTLIVHFWASWCGPCIEEVPSLIELTDKSKRVYVVAFSNDYQKADMDVFLKSFPRFHGDNIKVVFDSNFEMAKKMGVGKLPESYIFNSRGQLVRRVIGSTQWSTDEAIGYLNSL